MKKKKVHIIEPTISPANSTELGFSKLRVAAYARVSTDTDEQENSLSYQKLFYERKIASNPNWIFVGLYTDLGISGLSTKHRDGFNHLVDDALNGKIDKILTKSISRFARNTVDTLTTVRLLKSVGVSVFFEKEGIDTADANGEFIITLMSSVAQEESRSISENIRWTFRKKFEEGIVSTPVKLLGYHAGENGELILDKNESLIVTAIFSLFLQGKTPTEISLILNLLSIPSIKGNTDHWVMPRIRAILSNEKYKGDAKLQKFYTVDFLTHKVAKNRGEVRSYYVTNNHMPIVSRQDWDKAQLMLHSGRFPNTYRTFLSGKIYCDLCGASFGRQLWHSTTTPERVWRCYNSIHRNGTCPALHVYEAELVEAVKLSVLQLAYKYLAKLSALLNNLPKPPENKRIAFNQYISNLPSQVQIDETICDVDLRILLSKVIVLESGNVLIRFIDGTEYLQEII